MIRKNSILKVLIQVILMYAPCAVYGQTGPDYSVFLLGGSGSAYLQDSLLPMLAGKLAEAGKNSAVIFLGDNVQPRGLPDSTDHTWEPAHTSLMTQLRILQNYQGEIIFIPGPDDWARGRKDGLEYVKNQRKYIEDYLDKKDVFLPKKGRPGPEEIHLTEDIVVIAIDSWWWFHENEKSYADIEDEADFFVQIEDAISRNRNRKIIFAANHPLYSSGNYGGHFAAVDNLFPLLLVNKALYIPLPGFLYTGFRKFLGGKQDLAHPQYKLLKEALMESFEGHSDIIYASAHEQNLQYGHRDSLYQIISGSSGSTGYVAQNDKMEFASAKNGFAELDFYKNGDVWLEFLTMEEGEVFRTKLFNKPVYEKDRIEQFLSEIDYSDSTVTTYPNGEKYQAGKLKRVFFGDNYRDEWVIPVEVPVFDFKNEQGEL
ncbi:MAG: hypothetical protein P8100_15870, partial [bacterium]